LAQGLKNREQREAPAAGRSKQRPQDSGNIHPSRKRVFGNKRR
jgi:hypothetical protein